MTEIEVIRNKITNMIDEEIDKRLDDVSNYSEDSFVYHEIHNEIDTLEKCKYTIRRIILTNMENAKLLGVRK